MQESVKLCELDLGYNEIKDDGACALAQVCREESLHRYAGREVCTGVQGGRYAQVCRGESMHRYAGGKVCTGMQGEKSGTQHPQMKKRTGEMDT